jgi:hypothetical protein
MWRYGFKIARDKTNPSSAWIKNGVFPQSLESQYAWY